MLQYATGAARPGLPQKCSCFRDLDLEHAVHCDTAKLLRHNMLQRRFVAFAREQSVYVEENKRQTIEDAKQSQIPDIIFYFPPSPLETDVTVTNPCAPSRLLQTLNKAGAALQSRCQDKERKYLKRAAERGHKFVPLGFETHGRFSQHVLDLLGQIASNTPDDVGYAVSDMVLDLSLTLIRGNALCARRTLGRALRHRDVARSAI